MKSFELILGPVVTEKSTSDQKEGKYQFFVRRDATKVDIKKAFKLIYGVDVAKVNVMNTAKKTRIAGRYIATKRPEKKKVVITTKGRKTIDATKPTIK